VANEFFGYLGALFVISLSGALAPGPVTATAIAHGYRDPWAGTKVAFGHALVEVPLVAAIVAGLATVLSAPELRLAIGLVGGSVLILLGLGLLRRSSARPHAARPVSAAHSALVGGAVATVANPYVFLWWGTVGAYLFTPAIALGIAALVVSYVVHWSTDLIWNQALSSATHRAGRLWRPETERLVYAVVGAFLVGIGIAFALFAILALLGGEAISPIPGLSAETAGTVITVVAMLLTLLAWRQLHKSKAAPQQAASSEAGNGKA